MDAYTHSSTIYTVIVYFFFVLNVIVQYNKCISIKLLLPVSMVSWIVVVKTITSYAYLITGKQVRKTYGSNCVTLLSVCVWGGEGGCEHET